jgi:hypothetical protein
MSAYVVSKAHIDAMLSSMSPYTRSRNGNNMNAIGQKLVNQNYRSVNYRYHEHDEPEVYRFKLRMPLKPVEVIKACDCYAYQSCETPDWEDTEAYKICRQIREDAIHRLPGYEEAPWGIDD